MANIRVSDITEKSRITNRVDGLRATRVFLIENGGTDGIPSGRLVDAATSLGIPSPGDVHPSASSLFLTEVSCEPCVQSKSDFLMICTYEPPNVNNRKPSTSGICQFEAGATVAKKKFYTDKNGALMTVFAAISGNNLPPQPIEAEIDFPVPYIHFSRLEPAGASNFLPFVGKVNSIAWNPGFPTGSVPARCVLCSAIRISLQGAAWAFKYEFQLNYDSYDVIATYIDPQTKVPILSGLTGSSGATINGIPAFRVYSEADFTALGLYTGS